MGAAGGWAAPETLADRVRPDAGRGRSRGAATGGADPPGASWASVQGPGPGSGPDPAANRRVSASKSTLETSAGPGTGPASVGSSTRVSGGSISLGSSGGRFIGYPRVQGETRSGDRHAANGPSFAREGRPLRI